MTLVEEGRIGRVWVGESTIRGEEPVPSGGEGAPMQYVAVRVEDAE